MNPRILGSLVGALVAFAPAYGADGPRTYLCIADKSTGFQFHDGAWNHARFNVEGHRYLLKLKQDGEWALHRFGIESSMSSCKAEGDWIKCDGIYRFTFNMNNSRFISADLFGYADGLDKNDNTPMIEIGTCAAI